VSPSQMQTVVTGPELDIRSLTLINVAYNAGEQGGGAVKTAVPIGSRLAKGFERAAERTPRNNRGRGSM